MQAMNDRVTALMQALPDGEAELTLVVRLSWGDIARLGQEAGRLASRMQRPVTLDEAVSHRLRSARAAAAHAKPAGEQPQAAVSTGAGITGAAGFAVPAKPVPPCRPCRPGPRRTMRGLRRSRRGRRSNGSTGPRRPDGRQDVRGDGCPAVARIFVVALRAATRTGSQVGENGGA